MNDERLKQTVLELEAGLSERAAARAQRAELQAAVEAELAGGDLTESGLQRFNELQAKNLLWPGRLKLIDEKIARMVESLRLALQEQHTCALRDARLASEECGRKLRALYAELGIDAGSWGETVQHLVPRCRIVRQLDGLAVRIRHAKSATTAEELLANGRQLLERESAAVATG